MKKAEQRLIKTVGFYLLKRASVFRKNPDVDYDSKEIKVAQTTEINEDYDELWQRVSEQYNFCIVRDLNFMNWRYFNQKNSGYLVFEARKESKLLGWIVFKVFNYEEKYLTGHIVDCFFDLDEPEVAQLLVGKVLDVADEININSVDCIVS